MPRLHTVASGAARRAKGDAGRVNGKVVAVRGKPQRTNAVQMARSASNHAVEPSRPEKIDTLVRELLRLAREQGFLTRADLSDAITA
jgi:hypothetical protein